jgi:hypothetical protein
MVVLQEFRGQTRCREFLHVKGLHEKTARVREHCGFDQQYFRVFSGANIHKNDQSPLIKW